MENAKRENPWLFFIDDRPIEDLKPEERLARFWRQIGPCLAQLTEEEIGILRRAYLLDETDYTTGFWMQDGVFDGDPYQMRILSSCDNCCKYQGFEGFAPVCTAFPKGILPEIWLEESPCPFADSLPNKPKTD